MIDLSTKTIKNLFEKQIRELTDRTMVPKENSFDCLRQGLNPGVNTKNPDFHSWVFDFQMSGAWLQ